MKRIAVTLLALAVLTSCGVVSVNKTASVKVFYVGDTPNGFKLFSETREYPDTGNTYVRVISDLISGQSKPFDPDYSNLWNDSNSLNKISYHDNTATVDINFGGLNVGSETELRAIDQIVWTLTGIDSKIKSVKFLVNGKEVESLAGHVDATSEFKRAPTYEVLNPIQISSLNDGDFTLNPVVLRGEACTFEANVVWNLLSAGKVIKKGFTTADMACPVRSKWKINLGNLKSGNYLFKAMEYSAKDGSLWAIDSKRFKVK